MGRGRHESLGFRTKGTEDEFGAGRDRQWHSDEERNIIVLEDVGGFRCLTIYELL